MAHLFARTTGIHFTHGRGDRTVRGPFPGSFYGAAGFGPPPPSFYGAHRGGYDDEEDDDDDEYYHQYYERKRQQGERKAEAAKRKAEAEARRKAEARQRAQDEGRDCFEEWTVKALSQEATRRGFTIRGLQSQSIIDLLIDDERNKREKRELKEIAPLLDEWVEIVNVDDESRKKLNGIKARAVDYDQGPVLICRAVCACAHQETR
jgi:hypothetical protein